MLFPTSFVSDPRFMLHLTGAGHPECPERFLVIDHALKESGLLTAKNLIPCRLATSKQILLCHTSDYLEEVARNFMILHSRGINDGTFTLSTGDVQISSASMEVALLAVGGVLSAVDWVMTGVTRNAFCNVRPPGHHACSDKGMGFCIFNNIAIAARYIQKRYGLSKILIADWDLHHGNGTEEIFKRDPSVFYFSTHQEGIYPGTGSSSYRGEGPGVGSTLNCPIRAGSKSRLAILEAFQTLLAGEMEKFRPDFILISAGFDAHEHDPLGSLNLRSEDFAVLTRIMTGIAEKYCKGRLVSVLEGGYNLQALASAATFHAKELSQKVQGVAEENHNS